MRNLNRQLTPSHHHTDPCNSIEGVITLGCAFIGYVFTLPFPDQLLASGAKSSFTQAELEIILDRVERDRGDAEPDELTVSKVIRTGLRWELWVYGFMFLCCSAPIYAFAYFIQIILKTLGYSTAVVFLLCAPPYLFSIFWTVGVAWCADRTRLRMPWMVLNAAITLTGLLLTAYHKNNGVRYFGKSPHFQLLQLHVVYPSEYQLTSYRNLPRCLRLQRQPPHHHRLSIQQCPRRIPAFRRQRRPNALRSHRWHLRLLHVHAEGIPLLSDRCVVRRGDAVPLDGSRGSHVLVV